MRYINFEWVIKPSHKFFNLDFAILFDIQEIEYLLKKILFSITHKFGAHVLENFILDFVEALEVPHMIKQF